MSVGSPALAQQINTDYAHDFEFDGVKRFAYVETADTNSADPLMDGRIRDAIVSELKADGLRQVGSDADLYVTYQLDFKENMVLSTTGFGYGS